MFIQNGVLVVAHNSQQARPGPICTMSHSSRLLAVSDYYHRELTRTFRPRPIIHWLHNLRSRREHIHAIPPTHLRVGVRIRRHERMHRAVRLSRAIQRHRNDRFFPVQEPLKHLGISLSLLDVRTSKEIAMNAVPQMMKAPEFPPECSTLRSPG